MEQHMANALRLSFALFGLFLFASASAVYRPISLKDHYPQKYVVQPGDTLYDIANAYLTQPWQWKQLWRLNPKIKNPDRIYPGAIIKLEFAEGKPYLRLVRQGTYKLSPHARPRPAQKPVPPIHLSEIRPFLSGSRVFDTDELANSAYVVAVNGEHMLAGQNIEVYVRGLPKQEKNLSYAFYRPEGVYRSPAPQKPKRRYGSRYRKSKEGNDILGYVGHYLGSGQLVKSGVITTIEVEEITQGIRPKDRVVAHEAPDFDLYFEPQAPEITVNAEVIDLIGGISQVAQNQVIVLNLGQRQKLETGDVVGIWQKPKLVPDPLKNGSVLLPKERIGEAMVFRTFTNTAYALVVKSTRAIHKGDLLTNP